MARPSSSPGWKPSSRARSRPRKGTGLAHGTIGNDSLRLEFNEPGVHPFVSVLLPDDDGGWSVAALLGARQQRYFHTGAAFPRLITGGNEQDMGPLTQIDPLDGGLGV